MPNKNIAKIALALKYGKLILIFIFFILVVVAVLFFCIKDQTEYQNVDIGGQNFRLEVADTDELRTKGLSGRASIANNEGMLFDFGQTGNYGIWMKDMNFNIDVIWLDQNGQIVDILKNLSPDTYPQSFYADQTNRYVIELPVGTIDRLSIGQGSTIKLY
jgi:uncharacterized membrane protein (UPF0127 family)